MNPDKKQLKRNLDLLEYYAGNRALWNISRKYFGALAAAILATVLAKPELPKNIIFWNTTLSAIIQWYLGIGVVGLFFGELREAIDELLQTKTEFSMIFQKIFSGYTLIGVLIFVRLFSRLLE